MTAAEPATLRSVAIVVPTRDRPQFLDDALISAQRAVAAAGARVAAELIVVDNSSSDALTAAARSVAEAHGARFLESRPAGVSRARNLGVRSTTAELIGFLDDDDAYVDDYLTALLDLHDARPRLGIAFGQLMMADSDLNPVFVPVPPGPFPDGEAYAFSLRTIVSWNATLSKRQALLDAGAFDESIQQSEDWDLQMRVSASHDVAGVEQVVGLIRQHDRPRPTFARWLEVQRQCLEVERRGRRLRGRQPVGLVTRAMSSWPNRGRSAYNALSYARACLADGDRSQARRFVLGAMWRSTPHTVRLMTQFSDVLRAFAPGRRSA